MNTKAVKTFYDLLGHKKQTEIRAFELSPDFKVSKCKGHYFVSSQEEFLEKIRGLNGKYNLYTGLNERRNNGTETKDVISVKKIFLDIDCKNKPATKEDMIEASKVCNSIVCDLQKGLEAKPTIINSGNGYQLIYSIPEIEITDSNREEVQEKIHLFTKSLIEKYSNEKIKLDNVGDLPRIIRITGTLNIKGGKISQFVEVEKGESSKLKEHILNLKFDAKTYSKVQEKIEDIELKQKFQKILEIDEKVKKLYEGNFEGYKLSVGGELALVCYLIQYGFNKQEIFNIMASSKIGRWAEKNISYREETYKKALEKITKEKPTDEEKLKSFLVEDRQKYESLGCGYHNGVYYFGTKLFKKGKPFMAVVTSDKNLHIRKEVFYQDKKGNWKTRFEDEIKKVFGLNYKDDFFDEGLDNIISKEVINRWLFEDCNNVTIKTIYEKLIQTFKKYIYLEDERKYSLLACYRIAGFFMPVWRARARLFIYAEMGSAKSRLTQIMHNTGFNSIALGDWTLAYLQRLIESTRGETHIDDYETLEEDKKNATTRLVKTGFMRGFKAGKISEGKNRKPETYDLFNTTTLNNTEGLDFISTDRTITIRIPKISKKEYDREPNFSEPIWKELRDELYILGLKYPEQITTAYETITSDKIRGRLFFIIKPELTIAKLISEELYQHLENFWVEEIEQRQTIDFETDWEFLALKQIYKILSTQSTNSTLSTHSTLSTTNYFSLLNEVVEPLGIELYSEEGFKKKKRSMSIIIGNSLKRNPIFRKRQVRGKTQYKVDFDDLKSLLEAKGFLNPIQEILGVELVDCVDRVGKEMGKGQEKIDFSKKPKKPYKPKIELPFPFDKPDYEMEGRVEIKDSGQEQTE